jgi:hypothetical protein
MGAPLANEKIYFGFSIFKNNFLMDLYFQNIIFVSLRRCRRQNRALFAESDTNLHPKPLIRLDRSSKRAPLQAKAAPEPRDGIQQVRETNAQAISAIYAAWLKARGDLQTTLTSASAAIRSGALCASPSMPG